MHVCQKWRQVVFAFPQTLHLRLYCKHGRPVLKTLGCWPALPIVIQYGGSPSLDPPSPEDEDNVVSALKQSDRVSSISLTITGSLLYKLFLVEEPFSVLEDLVLLKNPMGLLLPNTFKWGSPLRRLHSTGIAFPALPQLLLPSIDLVDLQLHEIPGVGYFSPDAFASALSGMDQLKYLSLHFLSPASRPNHVDLSPSPGVRVVLPSLTHLKFRGVSEYLNSLVSKIDAPGLVAIEIGFFNQLILRLSQLGQFIDRIEMQKSHHRADILFSRRAVSISFTYPEARARLSLQISCEQLEWQLSSMAQICNYFSPFLPNVQDLGVDTTQRSSGNDDVDDEQWRELIRAFDGAEDFRVTGELATDILRALRPDDGEHETVLPALRNLCTPELMSIYGHGPLQEAVESFTTSRRLSGHPARVWPLSTISPTLGAAGEVEDMPGVSPAQYHCSPCGTSFKNRQYLRRHNADKHMPRNVCPYCGVFEWSGRKYLFHKHLETRHPQVASLVHSP